MATRVRLVGLVRGDRLRLRRNHANDRCHLLLGCGLLLCQWLADRGSLRHACRRLLGRKGLLLLAQNLMMTVMKASERRRTTPHLKAVVEWLLLGSSPCRRRH